MSQRKTLLKVPLTPTFTTNGLSYAEPDVDKFDMSNHVHVWEWIIPILQVYKMLRKTTHDNSYVKNTSVTKIPVIDHSKGDHSYADVVKLGNKHQHKHVGDHSYACTVEENGALHNKNNETSIV